MKTLNYRETYEVLGRFYEDCYQYWMETEFKCDAHDKAMGDVLSVKTNPLSPTSELLDKAAQYAFY